MISEEDLDPIIWNILELLDLFRDPTGSGEFVLNEVFEEMLVAEEHCDSHKAAHAKLMDFFWKKNSPARVLKYVSFRTIDKKKERFELAITPLGTHALTRHRMEEQREIKIVVEYALDRVVEIRKDIRDMNIRMIQIFGIFVSIFSLIVVQIWTAKEMSTTGDWVWVLGSYGFVVICILMLTVILRVII